MAWSSGAAASSMSGTTVRLPFVIYVLAAGVFLMGTTEFIVAGILPEIASDIGVGAADAGLMITVFAIGMIVGTPLMAIVYGSSLAVYSFISPLLTENTGQPQALGRRRPGFGCIDGDERLETGAVMADVVRAP